MYVVKILMQAGTVYISSAICCKKMYVLSCTSVASTEPIRMVRPLWCDRYGAATLVCTIRRADSMVLVFYGARQYAATVRRIYFLFGIFGGIYKGLYSNPYIR